jgi:uncharacterized RDD family membrane protein YckC
MSTSTASATYGGFWIRVIAFILDAIILGVVTGALSPIFGQPIFQTETITAGGNQFTINYTTGGALSGLLGLLYFVGFWSLRGQTPGQMPFRLRIVRASDGTRPDWIVALLRYVGMIISFAVILLGVIWVAFDGRKQGWHDKIAGTLVLRDPA